MLSVRGLAPLRFRTIARADLPCLASLDLRHAERFLEPLATIIGIVRRRPSHWVTGIEAGEALAGFYIVHPDQRDGACWWLGWLAIGREWTGRGLGRAALARAMAGFARLPSCRRIRLLVARDNAGAIALYRAAGFRVVDTWPPTDELVMEWARPDTTRADAVVVPALTLVLAMLMRLWRRGVPPAARMSGEFHGPPGGSLLALPAGG